MSVVGSGALVSASSDPHKQPKTAHAAMLDTVAFDNSDSHEVPADIRLFLPLFFSRA
jgi:hypothetical protein